MARRPGVQIRRRPRGDGSITYSLRVRVGGADDAILLGNSADGWDEARAERARQQTLAKIELGLWQPGTTTSNGSSGDREPPFAELATDWLIDRELNAAFRRRTTEDDRWRLTRYLIPFFGELLPSQITSMTIKQYRRRLHQENEHIRAAQRSGHPVRDPRSNQRLRPLSNGSINKTLRTLALVLDDAEDAGWIERNVARGRRVREPVQRHKRDALQADELVSILEAARELDSEAHRPGTLQRADEVRALRDDEHATWEEIARRIGVAATTAIYLYGCHPREGPPRIGPREALIATLGLAGVRVSELCALDLSDVDLTKRRISVRDAKTVAGVRAIDIRPRLLDTLSGYPVLGSAPTAGVPVFPTRTGARRDRHNVSNRVVAPTVAHANKLRAARGEAPILTDVTPHTFRRTYITIMLAAGFDVPYVQDQVGHSDPSTTLAVYAQVIRRPDRDQLRAEMRALLGENRAPSANGSDPFERRAGTRQRDLRSAERGGLER